MCFRVGMPRADPRGERADAPARGNQGGAAPAHRCLQERPPPSGRAGARRRQLEEAGRRLPPKTAVAAPRRRAAEADRQQNAADDPGQARPEAAAAAAGYAGHQGAKRQRGALLRVAAEEVVRPNGLEYRLNGGRFQVAAEQRGETCSGDADGVRARLWRPLGDGASAGKSVHQRRIPFGTGGG